MKKTLTKNMAALLAATMLLTGCGEQEPRPVAMTINGTAVTDSEFMIYMYSMTDSLETNVGETVWSMDFDGKTADEMVKDGALETLRTIIAAKEYAFDADINLTPSENTSARTNGSRNYTALPYKEKKTMGVTQDVVEQIFADSALYGKVYEALCNQVEVTEEDIAAYCAENEKTLQDDLSTFTVRRIQIETEADANAAYAELESGTDFMDVFKKYEYSSIEKAANAKGERTYAGTDLRGQADAVFDLQVNEYTEPIVLGGVYFIFRLEGVERPKASEVEEYGQEQCMQEMQGDYADGVLQELVEKQTVEINQEVWDNLPVFHD